MSLATQVLVLNKSYIPINIISVRRAFSLMYQGLARAVDHSFETYEFDSWCELSVAASEPGGVIGLVNRVIRIPQVILLVTYNRVPRRHVRFSRNNIYLRDHNTCQYCGQHLPRSELNLDHVIPRSRGGKTVWENVVTSCFPCNLNKGGKQPQEVGMTLIREPIRPRWTPFVDISLKAIHNGAWKPFFNVVDFSYWNVELKDS